MKNLKKIKIGISLLTVLLLSVVIFFWNRSGSTHVGDFVYHEMVRNKAVLKLSKNHPNKIFFDLKQGWRFTDVSSSCATVEMRHDTATVDWHETLKDEDTKESTTLLVSFDSTFFAFNVLFEETDGAVNYNINHDSLQTKPVRTFDEPIYITSHYVCYLKFPTPVTVYYDSMGHKDVALIRLTDTNVLVMKARNPFEETRMVTVEDGEKKYKLKVAFKENTNALFYDFGSKEATLISRNGKQSTN